MNVVQEDIVVKANGQDASAVEPIFLLGKSPSRNEATDVEESTGAGGLGKGSPKVRISLWKTSVHVHIFSPYLSEHDMHEL